MCYYYQLHKVLTLITYNTRKIITESFFNSIKTLLRESWKITFFQMLYNFRTVSMIIVKKKNP